MRPRWDATLSPEHFEQVGMTLALDVTRCPFLPAVKEVDLSMLSSTVHCWDF